MAFSKVYESAAAAVSDIGDGATVLVGGAAADSEATGLLTALAAKGVRGLTCVCDFSHWDGADGVIRLAESGSIGTVISPFPFAGPDGGALHRLWQAGQLDVVVIPQGTLSERLRAAGAGIGGVFLPAGARATELSPTGASSVGASPVGVPSAGASQVGVSPTGTTPAGVSSVGVSPTGASSVGSARFAEGRELRTIDGAVCVLEGPLRADFALLRAAQADTLGNLAYRGAQRGWNATMAPAARITIVEADSIGEPGVIDPELVITPGIYVNRIVAAQTTATSEQATAVSDRSRVGAGNGGIDDDDRIGNRQPGAAGDGV